ncbi:MAG: hypothetical protein J0I48_15490 [Devosia sp.]|mgnify:CR=1 FL=1|uniref:WapI family immunity protein n=1 Tax=Devosia sp. 66-22 TaxID=1895753 RepID=UPI000926609B|nr:hypothetical protein [Devosia sp. 66-22]MBN9347574.1 hypothetical protein [Devosia sp.]OJX51574.1 MAG: hypothetical protein BGO81_13080 [Devosia sp. 66-22]
MDRDADLTIAGLSIWVEGPQTYGNGHVDRQWLELRAVAEAPGARIEIAGPFLRRMDFRSFCRELAAVHKCLLGTAQLCSPEPDMNLRVKGDGMGHIEITLDLMSRDGDQTHRIIWTVDQTYLPTSLSQLRALLITATLAARRARRPT